MKRDMEKRMTELRVLERRLDVGLMRGIPCRRKQNHTRLRGIEVNIQLSLGRSSKGK